MSPFRDVGGKVIGYSEAEADRWHATYNAAIAGTLANPELVRRLTSPEECAAAAKQIDAFARMVADQAHGEVR